SPGSRPPRFSSRWSASGSPCPRSASCPMPGPGGNMQAPTTAGHADMNESLTIAALARSVWHDFRHARPSLVIYEILFKLVEAWLLVPVVAVVLAAILSRAGHLAVSNRDILDFLLTPSGLLYAALFSTIALALLLFEQAGVMVLVALIGAAERPPVKQ